MMRLLPLPVLSWRPVVALHAALWLVACGGVGDAAVTTPPTTTPVTSATFTLTSSATAADGSLSTTYTCDGTSTSPPLSWRGLPTGTVSLAMLMTTIPTQGATKYNWLLYNLPVTDSSIAAGTNGQGTVGFADDGGGLSYASPCSQGPGLKTYTFTLYALSQRPTLMGLAANQVTGAALTAAMASITLKTAALNVSITRTAATINCGYVKQSLTPFTAANALSVACDSTYAAISTTGIQSKHAMMNGITATNQQVPLPQNFTGTNAWRIPLTPQVAVTKTAAVDGPIGIAVNGVPIFNPCKQGGCNAGAGGGDTKVLGELDLCNGHAGRADDYHYHAAPTCMMSEQSATYWDTHPLGWALDGYAIFGYRNPDGTTATRDTGCGGNTVTHPNAPTGYAYHVTDVSPYVLSCFHGVPSPDLAGQGAKYSPIRPAGTPQRGATNMTLDATAARLAVGGITTMRWTVGVDTFEIRYTRTSAICWNFVFVTNAATTASASYCRAR